jgi:hypothetical protein
VFGYNIDTVSKIEISYVDFDILTFVDIDCDRFTFAFSEIKRHKVIHGLCKTNELLNILENLTIL